MGKDYSLELKDQMRLFADEYLVDLNGQQAAIRAGYSPKTAGSQASRLLKSVKVRAYIDMKMAEISKRTGTSTERVLRELGRIAFVNPLDVIDMTSAEILDTASRDDTAVIASVKVKKIPTEDGMGIEREIRMVDKIKALELLGKYHRMFTDQIDLTGQVQFVNIIDDLGTKDPGCGDSDDS